MAKKPATAPPGPRFGAHGTSEKAPMPGPSPTGQVQYKQGAMASKRPGGGTLGRQTITLKRSGKRGA